MLQVGFALSHLDPNFCASLVWEDLEANKWCVADCIEDRHCLALCVDRRGVMTFDFVIRR